MAYSHHERLSALDDSFLELEDASSHMHIGAVAVFDGPLDLDAVHHLMEVTLHRVPRYRQRIVHVPIVGQPVWVDDDRFNLTYHLRHTRLPLPGDERQLKRLAGRIMSQQLDRGKPLWEMWLIEGLEDGRVAIVTKAHHCMIDGVGSVELTGALMSPTPDRDPRLDEPAPRWTPRPQPSRAVLLGSELLHRVTAPLDVVRGVVGAPCAALRAVPDVVGGVASAIGTGLRSASPTPLNVAIGPHRRFDWTIMDLNVLKDVRSRLEGTVNDAVLSMLSGALGRFLVRRGVPVEGLDFRAMVPVNVRTAATRGHVGNQVAMMVVRLPLDERDARRRLARVVAETRRAKTSSQAAGMQAIEELSDRTFTTLFTEFARLTALSRPYNIVVTNVPGPPFPVHVLGARMTACYPLVPLFQNQALGVALFSYDGRLYWGFNTDWDVLPDVHELVEGVRDEYAALCAAARIGEDDGRPAQEAS